MPRLIASSLLSGLFLLCALPVLLFIALCVPTGESPDEVAHIVRMESLLNRMVVGYRIPRLDNGGNAVADSGVRANQALLAAGFAFIPGTPLADRTLTRARSATLRAIPWDPAPVFVSVPNTAVYAPLFYIPGAIGMGVARYLGNGPYDSILAARVVNALTYLAIGLLALVVARRMRGVLLAVLLLPISLWLGASCNQDGLMIASSVLAVALLTRGTLAGWWGAVLMVGVVAMVKPLYLPLVGVIAVLAPGRGLQPVLRGAGAILAAMPALLWYAVAQRYAVVPFVRGEPYQAGPNWPGDPAQVFGVVDASVQLQVLLHKPSLLFTLPVQAMEAHGAWLIWEMVGLLGILDILLPASLYVLWFWAFGALTIGEGLTSWRAPKAPGLAACLAVLACVVATVFAVFDGQYLSWTHIGASEIEGVQGRYFIPLLPFLALAIPMVRAPGASVLRWALRAPAILAGLAGVVIIPGLVVARYYLR